MTTQEDTPAQPAIEVENIQPVKAARRKVLKLAEIRELRFIDAAGDWYYLDDWRPGGIFILRPAPKE